jgi:tetratricopeptide (TPR) repeat protein
MGRAAVTGLATCLLACPAWSQPGDQGPQKVLVLGGNSYLSAGADAIRAGLFDDGIRLTMTGLERDGPSERNRAAGLANLCAAFVAKGEPDTALPYCTDSLALNAGNWRAYSNRSHAYLLKEMYDEAAADNAAAAALSPNADHVVWIRGILNEYRLRPRVLVEDHQ